MHHQSSEKFDNERRADADVVRILSASIGAHYARSWQNVPFFSVPKSVYWDWKGDEDMLQACPNTENKPLPYECFVLHFRDFFEENIGFFVRVASPETAEGTFVTTDGMKLICRKLQNQCFLRCVLQGIFCLADENNLQARIVAATLSDSPAGELLVFGHWASYATVDGKLLTTTIDDAGEFQKDMKMAQTATTAVNNTLGYLMRGPKHMLATRSLAPRVSRKTANLKPWLRDDLPTIQLMSAEDASACGQPQSEVIGNRHAPRPHARRGHWRRLGESADGGIRKTFVRPAWIGPEAWDHEGRHYELVVPQPEAL